MTTPADVVHSSARTATVGRMELRYDMFGDPADPMMLLIMGMGFQLIHWPEDFCRELAAQGFRVVRFDNRDAGRSTHLPGRRYRLEDMAADSIGLLDVLGVHSAHIVGASMGGMIAQTVAIRYPDRIRSLASLMSTTGRRGVGRTSPRVLRYAFGRRPRTVEEAVERRVRVFAAIGSPGFDRDLDGLRAVTAMAFERDPDARDGRHRQHHAVRAAADRTQALGGLTVPTVAIHGTHDLMCDPSGGRATADAVPGARFELIGGMGHDLPRDAWPRIIGVITRNAARSAE